MVRTQRFDEWYAENNMQIIDLLWIDVQGAEKEVLEGLGDKISNIKFIWIEYGEGCYEGALNRNETLLLLANKGFREIPTCSDQTPQGDVLCVNHR